MDYWNCFGNDSEKEIESFVNKICARVNATETADKNVESADLENHIDGAGSIVKDSDQIFEEPYTSCSTSYVVPNDCSKECYIPNFTRSIVKDVDQISGDPYTSCSTSSDVLDKPNECYIPNFFSSESKTFNFVQPEKELLESIIKTDGKIKIIDKKGGKIKIIDKPFCDEINAKPQTECSIKEVISVIKKLNFPVTGKKRVIVRVHTGHSNTIAILSPDKIIDPVTFSNGREPNAVNQNTNTDIQKKEKLVTYTSICENIKDKIVRKVEGNLRYDNFQEKVNTNQALHLEKLPCSDPEVSIKKRSEDIDPLMEVFSPTKNPDESIGVGNLNINTNYEINENVNQSASLQTSHDCFDHHASIKQEPVEINFFMQQPKNKYIIEEVKQEDLFTDIKEETADCSEANCQCYKTKENVLLEKIKQESSETKESFEPVNQEHSSNNHSFIDCNHDENEGGMSPKSTKELPNELSTGHLYRKEKNIEDVNDNNMTEIVRNNMAGFHISNVMSLDQIQEQLSSLGETETGLIYSGSDADGIQEDGDGKEWRFYGQDGQKVGMAVKIKKDKPHFQESSVNMKDVMVDYAIGSKHPCLVCGITCLVTKNKRLPKLPLCKPCKKSFFYLEKSTGEQKKCINGGQCRIRRHFTNCSVCFLRKFKAILTKWVKAMSRRQKKTSSKWVVLDPSSDEEGEEGSDVKEVNTEGITFMHISDDSDQEETDAMTLTVADQSNNQSGSDNEVDIETCDMADVSVDLDVDLEPGLSEELQAKSPLLSKDQLLTDLKNKINSHSVYPNLRNSENFKIITNLNQHFIISANKGYINHHEYCAAMPDYFNPHQPVILKSHYRKRKRLFVDDLTVETMSLEKANHHNRLERQRRQKLSDLFSDLRDQIPGINSNPKITKVNILDCATMSIEFLENVNMNQEKVKKKLNELKILQLALKQKLDVGSVIDSLTQASIDKIEAEICAIAYEYDESLKSCLSEMKRCRYGSSMFQGFLQFSDMPDHFLPISHQLTAKDLNLINLTLARETHILAKTAKPLASMKAGCSTSATIAYSDPIYDDSIYSDQLSPGSPDEEDGNILVYSENLSIGQITQLEAYDPVIVLSRVSPAMDIYS